MGVLGIGDLTGGAVFWAEFGFSGSGWLRWPVGVPDELLGQVHVAIFGCHPPWAHPGQKFVCLQVNASLNIHSPRINRIKYTRKRRDERFS